MTDRSIDLLDGEFYTNNPYKTYKELREDDPIFWDETNEMWGISRYDDIVEIEKNINLRIGDKLSVIPVHSCLTVDKMQEFYVDDNKFKIMT